MTAIRHAGEGAATPSTALLDEASRTPPAGVDALLWRLSSPQQRQSLLQAVVPATAYALPAHSSAAPVELLPVFTREGRGLGEVRAQASWLDAPARAAASRTGAASDQAREAVIVQGFQQRFASAAADPSRFNTMMRESFGDRIDASKLEALRQQSLRGDFSWMPEVKLADASTLQDLTGAHGADIRGAYAQGQDTVYLNRDLLKDPALAEQVLSEEIGHAIDARLNTTDAAGDEGHLFTELLHGQHVDAQELQALRAEDDHGAIQVDGRREAVEFDDGGGGDSSSSSSSSESSSSSSSEGSSGSSEGSASSSEGSSSEGSSESAGAGESSASEGSEGPGAEGTDSSASGAEGEGAAGTESADGEGGADGSDGSAGARGGSGETSDSSNAGDDDSGPADSLSELAAPAFADPEAADAPESAPEDADAGDDEDDAEAQAKSRDAKPKDAAREAGESPEGPTEAPPEREALQAKFREMELQYRRENDIGAVDGPVMVAGMPMNGPPNTWRLNPTGSGQWRFYGSDGRPSVDLDSDHSHNGMRPHAHNWNGDNRNGAVAPFSPYPGR